MAVPVIGATAKATDLIAEGVFDAQVKWGQAIAEAYINIMKGAGREASGKTIKGIHIRIQKAGIVQVVDGNGTAVFAFFGRSPGKFPPPDKIRQWIRVKPITPSPGPDGRTPTINQLAFLIGRKIAEDGIDPITTENELTRVVTQTGRPFLQEIGEITAKIAGAETVNNFVKRNKELGLKTKVVKG